ncbi:MAG: hypothetical protein KC656_32505 [Myxococcales bacterium]|nr:hypothetical protein [Myxococcales bacterium]
MRTLPLALFALACAPGTSGPRTGEFHSCDLSDSAGYCLEYDGLAADGAVAAYEAACAGGTWSEGPCETAGTLGGCMGAPEGGFTFTLTTWFSGGYPSAAALQEGCESGGDTYLAP